MFAKILAYIVRRRFDAGSEFDVNWMKECDVDSLLLKETNPSTPHTAKWTNGRRGSGDSIVSDTRLLFL